MNRTRAVFLLLIMSICVASANNTYEHPEYIGVMLRKIDELQVKIANLENAETKLRASLAVANAKLADQDKIEQQVKELKQSNTQMKEEVDGTVAKLSLDVDFLKKRIQLIEKLHKDDFIETLSDQHTEEFGSKRGNFTNLRNKLRGKNSVKFSKHRNISHRATVM